MAAALPQAQVTILAAAGHAGYLDAPDDFHRHLLHFLAPAP